MEKVETKIVTLDELLALDLKGKVIVFPTDTVYGVGALVDEMDAVNRIYELKRRDLDKPLAILCGSYNQVLPYIENPSAFATSLIKEHWPGALTIIFKKSNLLQDQATRGKKTVAFRMPNSKIALSILETFGLMATTSVNLSGEKELNTVSEIYEEFNGKIDYIVSDTEPVEKLPSTIYDDTTSKVLRVGSVIIK